MIHGGCGIAGPAANLQPVSRMNGGAGAPWHKIRSSAHF
jgi:hypothetical protein